MTCQRRFVSITVTGYGGIMRDKTRSLLEEQGAKVGLRVNATKAKVMRFGTKGGDGVLIAGEWI